MGMNWTVDPSEYVSHLSFLVGSRPAVTPELDSASAFGPSVEVDAKISRISRACSELVGIVLKLSP